MASYYTGYDLCVAEGTHLVDVDDEGTCTSCGDARP